MRPKSSKKTCKTNAIADYLSNLPKDILHHILSFLDMKQVVQMSTISRRWRYLWLAVRHLNFYYPREKYCQRKGYMKVCPSWLSQKQRFMGFVNEVLCRHNDSIITKVHFSCWRHCGINKLDTFINAITRLNIRELHIDVVVEDFQRLHSLLGYLFNSEIECLTFQVSGSGLEHLHITPPAMCTAAHLKTLKLVNVTLPLYDVSLGIEVTCPVLQNLFLIDCVHRFDFLSISPPQLKTLMIKNSDERIYCCKLKVCTHSLKLFRCEGYMYRDYSLENVTSIDSAYVELRPSDKNQGCIQRLVKALTVFTNTVLTVSLNGCWFQEPEFPVTLEWLLNPIQSLRYLKLEKWSNMCSIQAVTSLLKVSPFIGIIVWEIWQELAMTGDERGVVLDFECTFHELKSIEIQNFSGSEDELKLVEFVLKNAVVLKNITIIMNKAFSKDKENVAGYINKLQSLLKASSRVNMLVL